MFCSHMLPRTRMSRIRSTAARRYDLSVWRGSSSVFNCSGMLSSRMMFCMLARTPWLVPGDGGGYSIVWCVEALVLEGSSRIDWLERRCERAFASARGGRARSVPNGEVIWHSSLAFSRGRPLACNSHVYSRMRMQLLSRLILGARPRTWSSDQSLLWARTPAPGAGL